jgi:hypothetical protein
LSVSVNLLNIFLNFYFLLMRLFRIRPVFFSGFWSPLYFLSRAIKISSLKAQFNLAYQHCCFLDLHTTYYAICEVTKKKGRKRGLYSELRKSAIVRRGNVI